MANSSTLAQLARGSSALSALRSRSSSTAGNDSVTVSEWSAQVGPNGLTETCTVTAKAAGALITGIGLLAFSADGATQYGTQYTANLNSASVLPSLTIGGLALPGGTQVMAIVFGYIQGQEFYFEQKLTV